MPARVNAESFDAEVLQSDKPVLVDFYSDSCVPCKRMNPLLAELEQTYAEILKIVKVNVNFDRELAERYAVQAAPTLVFFQNGTESGRLRGAVNKAQLTELIEQLGKTEE